jgi:hypothetical protein
LVRRAYRRPIDDEDLKTPMEFYRQGRAEGDFDAGIEMALNSVLVNPQFLFRIERDPPEITSETAYRIDDVELASRLSYFLWSSMPDDELLDLATGSRGSIRRGGPEQRVHETPSFSAPPSRKRATCPGERRPGCIAASPPPRARLPPRG